jgi:hypothetical protein
MQAPLCIWATGPQRASPAHAALRMQDRTWHSAGDSAGVSSSWLSMSCCGAWKHSAAAERSPQPISTFLDASAANPNTINGQLTALDTQLNGATGNRAQITALRATLVAPQSNATAFATGVTALSTVAATLNNYATARWAQSSLRL